MPDLVDWNFTDSTSLDLCKNNIHIIKCFGGSTVSTYKHAKDHKVGEINHGTQPNTLVYQTTQECILFTIN